MTDEEVESRVKARMEKLGAEGEERSASIQARPCLPVAPVIRRVLDILEAAKYELGRVMSSS